MKRLLHTVRSHRFHAAEISALGLLVVLAGCANAPIRQTTTVADTSFALVAATDGNIEAPVPVRTVKPQYPYELWRYTMGGDIQLTCLIGEDGVVREAKVLKTSAWELEQPALRALEQWTFKPAQRDGVPIAQWVTIPMKFFFID
jgi:protein TonB